MKHRNIEASAISNLVRESHLAANASSQIAMLLVRLDDRLKPYFTNRRKLDAITLKSLFEWCRDTVSAVFPSIDYDEAYVPPTRAHPKGEMYQARFVAVKQIEHSSNGSEQYQLFNFRIFATRKRVELEIQDQPFAFQYHTAERLLERALEKGEALYRLGLSLYKWSRAILALRGLSQAALDNRLLLPTSEADGVLLCEFVSHPIYSGYSRIYDSNGATERGIEVGNFDFMLLAKTFVGRHMLGEDQSSLAQRLQDWREENASELLQGNRSVFWRGNFGVWSRNILPVDQVAKDRLVAVITDSKSVATIACQ